MRKIVKSGILTRREKIKELDRLARIAVIARDSGCIVCGKRADVHCAHIFPRNRLNTRWDLDNLVCLCLYHHFYFAHKNPIEFAELIKKRLGEEKFNRLRMRANTSGKNLDLEAVKLYLKKESKKYNELKKHKIII